MNKYTRLFIDESRVYIPGIAALTWAMERGFEKLSGDGVDGTLVRGLEAAVPVLARMIDDVEEYGAPQSDSGGLVAALEATL